MPTLQLVGLVRVKDCLDFAFLLRLLFPTSLNLLFVVKIFELALILLKYEKDKAFVTKMVSKEEFEKVSEF